MAIAWILGVFFIFVTAAFVTLAIFFPEWVGITGKKAKETIKHHRGDENLDPQSTQGKDRDEDRTDA